MKPKQPDLAEEWKKEFLIRQHKMHVGEKKYRIEIAKEKKERQGEFMKSIKESKKS
jgi:hypothetical protein